MPRPVGVVAMVLVLVGTACAGPSTVEASVRDAFVDCMVEHGITVADVEVGVRDGRHVETFSWESTDGRPEGDVAEECEDAALQRFEVSRT